MRLRAASLALALLSVSSAVAATGSIWKRSPPGRGGGSDYDDDGDDGGSHQGPPQPSPSSGGNASDAATSESIRGDSACGGSVCVAAVVNGSTVRYTLTSPRQDVGWMAIGFGTRMVQSPMVIMWANGDGSLTLSQRLATRQAEPAVQAQPPRIATAQSSVSVTSGSTPQYVFDIPANSDTTQSLIWAYSNVKPADASTGARIEEHTDQGRLTLDLTKVTSSGGGGSDGDTAPNNNDTIPITSNERTMLAHAIIATIGFLLILPVGALIPRYMRTFTVGWFKLHWIIQFILGGLTVVIGVVLGIVAVAQSGGQHLSTTHMRVGIALFCLYFAQVSLGAIIHFIKPKSAARRRPPQNYIHAILGLLIIALALYQVRLGYKYTWPGTTGRTTPNGVNILWCIWAALIPTAYAAGLFFLPKQLRQERASRDGQAKLGPME